MFYAVDKDLTYDYTLILCKPNREQLAVLSEAYNRKFTPKLKDIAELSFTIPLYIIDKNHHQARNPHFDLIRGDYLIYMIVSKGDTVVHEHYFKIITPKKHGGDSDTKDVQCYSLEYGLRDWHLRLFSGTRQLYQIAGDTENGLGILNELEEQQNTWKVGYLDPLVVNEITEGQEHHKYRTFDISDKTWLDVIRSEIETAFDCICDFDTVNKLINVYSLDTISQNKGLYISEENFLRNVDEEPKFDEIVTQLRVYGKDNLSISSVNLSSDYIEDYSYYRTTDYMSQGLLDALNAYDTLCNQKRTEFSSLLTQLATQQQLLITKQGELTDLNTALSLIQDNIDAAIVAQQSLTDLNTQKSAKTTEINNKQAEIDSVNTAINNINNSIATIRTQIDKTNNFTTEQLEELDSFIKQDNWQNNNYYEVNSLYEAGKKALQNMNQPTITRSIDMVDLFSIVECQYYWDKFDIGDIITIDYSKWNQIIELRIVSFTHDIDNNQLTIEVSNKDSKDDAARYLTDSIAENMTAGTTVDMFKDIWNLSKINNETIDTFMNNALDAAKQHIISSHNQGISIDERGINLRDMNDTNEQMRLLNNLLVLTTDGFQTVNLAITPHGIIAENLVGKILISEKLFLKDSTGTIQIVGNLFSIQDDKGNYRVKLGNYATGKYGLQVLSKDGNSTVLDEDGMLQVWGFPVIRNVDGTHPLKFKLYIDDNTISVKQVKLAFTLEPFRTDSKAIIVGSPSVNTTSSGGYYDASGVSQHWGSPKYVPTLHTVLYLTETTPAGEGVYVHYEDFVHDHPFKIPDHHHSLQGHTHASNIQYGIFESTSATGVTIKVDGTVADNNGGTGYSSDKTDIDITQYVQTSGWHTIELTSTQLGCINVFVYIKEFVGTTIA